tara:strand:- start:7589 stop:8383 length:795 start_codon:yes stop_codon:yes gene_type:complete
MSLNEKIHFIHANGFPANAYKNLLNDINKDYNIIKFNLNKKKYLNIKDWTPFHKDFINTICHNDKIIGIGHSIGGNIILRSALSNQSSFSKIILLDPTLFVPRIIFLWRLTMHLKIHNYLHPWVKATLKRRMNYENIDQILTSYRNKKVFSKINDENLSIYIKSIIKTNTNKTLKITYPKELEYQIYKTGLIADYYIWKNIKKLKIPVLIIRSESSNAFLESAATKVKKLNNNIEFIEINNSTHLFPLEMPELISDHIIKFLKK